MLHTPDPSLPLPQRLTRIVRAGLLIILAALPFHAVIVTVLSRALGWSTSDWVSPWVQLLQAWKEIALVVLAILIAIRSILQRKLPFRPLPIDLFVVALLVLCLITLPVSTGWYTSWLWGLRTDFAFVLPWLLARSVPWNVKQLRTLFLVLGGSAVLSLLLALAHGLLPEDILVQLGYSPYVSSWVPGKPLPLFHALGETTRRWMGPMSGPNQFAAALLLLIGLAIGVLLAKRLAEARAHAASLRFPSWIIVIGGTVALILTMSRGAMLGGLAMLVVLALGALPTLQKRLAAAAVLVLLACGSIGAYALLDPTGFQTRIVRAGSSDDHVTKFVRGLGVIADHPAGIGLGQAGPVSVRFRAVEIGGDGGLVSESWYLQIGQELGIAGLALMLAYLVALLIQCVRLGRAARDPELRALAWGAGLGAVGVMVQAVFLHTFADNMPVTLTLWTLFGIIAERTATYVAPTSTLKSKALHALTEARARPDEPLADRAR